MSNTLIKRQLVLPVEDSLLLFGPRGVGKSTLLKAQFGVQDCLWIDLV